MIINLVKQYAKGDNLLEICGTIDVNDEPAFREAMDRREIQSADERIGWSVDCDKLRDDGYEYVDFSFDIDEDLIDDDEDE